MKTYEVGGCVRDELLGVRSKDIDFSVVLEESDMTSSAYANTMPYEIMVVRLQDMGVKIIRGDDGLPIGHNYLTARGIHPERGAVDYVLARKESDYADGRRPDRVEIGTLEDDLARRDFTMNAIAKGEDGTLIDPFNGASDIEAGIIRAVGDPLERLEEDALRAVRALRFSVTKIRETNDGHDNFRIDPALANAMETVSVLDSVANNISDERIQQELSKMFRFDTLGSLYALSKFDALTEAMFSGSVSLDATMKTKGRGK